MVERFRQQASKPGVSVSIFLDADTIGHQLGFVHVFNLLLSVLQFGLPPAGKDGAAAADAAKPGVKAAPKPKLNKDSAPEQLALVKGKELLGTPLQVGTSLQQIGYRYICRIAWRQNPCEQLLGMPLQVHGGMLLRPPAIPCTCAAVDAALLAIAWLQSMQTLETPRHLTSSPACRRFAAGASLHSTPHLVVPLFKPPSSCCRPPTAPSSASSCCRCRPSPCPRALAWSLGPHYLQGFHCLQQHNFCQP